jgi:hypothetical protein
VFRKITANIVAYFHNDVLSISTYCFITVMLERCLNIRYVVISKRLNMLAADLHSFLTFHGTTLEIRLKIRRSRVMFSFIRRVVICVEQSQLTVKHGE